MPTELTLKFADAALSRNGLAAGSTPVFGCKYKVKINLDKAADRDLTFQIRSAYCTAPVAGAIPNGSAAGDYEFDITFDKWATSGNLQIVPAGADLKARSPMAVTLKPLQVNFAATWLEYSGSSVDAENESLVQGRNYHVCLRIEPQAPDIQVKARISSRIFGNVECNIQGTQDHKQQVTVSQTSLDYDEIKLTAVTAGCEVATDKKRAWSGLELQFADPGITGAKNNEIEIGKDYTLRFSLNSWSDTDVKVNLQSDLFHGGKKEVTVHVAAKGKKRFMGLSEEKPQVEIQVKFDLWHAGAKAVTIAEGGYTVGARKTITLKPVGTKVSFDASWLKEGATAVATDKPLKRSTDYNVHVKIEAAQAQDVKVKVKSAAFVQPEYPVTVPAGQTTASVTVKNAADCKDWTDVTLEPVENCSPGDSISQKVQVGFILQFPKRPFLVGGKGVALEEIEIGKEYEMRVLLAYPAAFGTSKLKLSSPFLKTAREVDITSPPVSTSRRSSKKPYVTFKITFDQFAAGQQHLKIDAGDYKPGTPEQLPLKAKATPIEFDTPWLTLANADAKPEEKALELYAKYRVHVKLAKASLQDIEVKVESAAFHQPVIIKLPAGATTASGEVQTGKPCDDWTEVRLVGVTNCSPGPNSKTRCWVEAPEIKFADSPLSRAMASVQDLLKLTPGKHMLHFQLSYAPHQPPPGITPTLKLQSDVLGGAPVSVPIPVGVTSFSHEVDLKNATTTARDITINQGVGYFPALIKSGRSKVPPFLKVAVKAPTIEFDGCATPPPYEDNQPVQFRFKLVGGAGSAGAKATFECAALTAPLAVTFAAFAVDGAEVLVDGQFKTVAAERTSTPKPQALLVGFNHQAILKKGDGCGAVSVGESFRILKGIYGPGDECKWTLTVHRPRIYFDPQATGTDRHRPGAKFKVRVVLPDGPPKHADIEAELECPSVVQGPHMKLRFPKGGSESSKIIELEVADIVDPKGIAQSRLAGMQHSNLLNVKSLDMVNFKDGTLVNCISGATDGEEHSVPALLVRLDLLKVSFHRSQAFRPETGFFPEEKVIFTVTHSYEAPAGAKAQIECDALAVTPLDVPLKAGALFTTVEATAKAGLTPGSKYKAVLKPVTRCTAGERTEIKPEAHVRATLLFGGKRKHRIEPEKGPYEPNQNITLSVHLEFHRTGRAHQAGVAPPGGCPFAIECNGFESTVEGVIPAGRSEAIVSAKIKNAPGTHIARLRLKGGSGLVDEYRGCRVTQNADKNQVSIEVGNVPRYRVFFDDTSAQTAATTDQVVGTPGTVIVRLNQAVVRVVGDKTVKARVSSTALSTPVIVDFLPGEQQKSVSLPWANPSHQFQLVRVDGLQRCEADTEGTTTRTDRKLTSPKRKHLFTVKFPAAPATPVAPCPQVERAITEAASENCSVEKVYIVERHGEKANVIPERGPKRDGAFEIPLSAPIQVIAGRKQDVIGEGKPEFHRTEILVRFPGKNNIKPADHHMESIHPAIYLYRLDKKGNRVAAFPVNPFSQRPGQTLAITPGFWDVRYDVVAGKDVRGLQVHQATLPFFETPNSIEGFGPGLWNKVKRSIPTLDFWNMLRQQKPRITKYEVEVRDCAKTRTAEIQVYPSDEYALSIKVKPFAPFSWGVDGDVMNAMGVVKPLDDLRTQEWESQYADSALREESPIEGGTPGVSLNLSEISSRQNRGRIPCVPANTLALLTNEMDGLELLFQIADTVPSSTAPFTLNPGGVSVVPGDYVEWARTVFAKASKPGSLSWTVKELNELTPEDRALYKVKSNGKVFKGLEVVSGKPANKELPVLANEFLIFDEQTGRWRKVGDEKCTVADLKSRFRKDGVLRKLVNAGKLTNGAVDVVADDVVIWRADRNSWEKVDPSTAVELGGPADGDLFLETSGAKVVGARIRKAGKWEKLERKSPDELTAINAREDGIWGVQGRGQIVDGALDVEDNDAVEWDGAKWIKLPRRSVEDLNPKAKSGEICKAEQSFTWKGTNFPAGCFVELDNSGDWNEIPSKDISQINAIATPVDRELCHVTEDGVLTKGQLAVSVGDLVQYGGGKWQIRSVASHDRTWFAPFDAADGDRVVLSNSGKVIAGDVAGAAGMVLTFDGAEWAQTDLAGRKPVSFFNGEKVNDGQRYSVNADGKIGALTVKAGDIVRYDGSAKEWKSELVATKPKWESSWFDWVPVSGESYVLPAGGTIAGLVFDPGAVAVYDGAAWIKATEEVVPGKVENLNRELADREIWTVTDSGKLKPGDVDVAIDDLVEWAEATSIWVKRDKSQFVEWSPDDFNDREELLLNTFEVKDGGAPLRLGALTVAAGKFVRFHSYNYVWVETEEPDGTRAVKSIGRFDDTQWKAQVSGADSSVPLTSIAPTRSNFCFYPEEPAGGLPESWQQMPKDEEQLEKSEEVQSEYDELSAYAGFIPNMVSDRIQIAMTRNGKEDALCAEMRRLAFTIAFLAQSFKQLLEASDNAVPTFGYSVSAVINIFEGELLVRWGWKEFTDNQVFYWEQIHANIMVFRIGARVDLGFRYNVMVARAEAIIYFKITLELKWEKGWERRGPGQQMDGANAWTSVIGKVELGASLVLLHENWFSANVAGTSGIEAKFRWVSSSAGGTEWQIFFLGIILNGKLKVLGFREIAFSKPLKKGSPPGIPWKRGMLPGTANASYYEIRATFGLNMSKIIWDRNNLQDALESMIEVQQNLLRRRTHVPGAAAPQCTVCHSKGIQPKGRGWPVAIRPTEAGWTEQWAEWVKSIDAEETTPPRLVWKIQRRGPNSVSRTNLFVKLGEIESDRKAIEAAVLARLELAEKRLDEIAGLERQVDDAEGAGDERPETVDDLYALAKETEHWMEEIRSGEPVAPPDKPVSITSLIKDIRWWCRRLEHYTELQKHWGKA